MIYSIRPFVEADIDAYKSMRLEALKLGPSMYGISLTKALTFSEEEWSNAVLKKRNCCFGLYQERELIGITGILGSADKPGEAYMTQSYIRKAYRGRGLSALFFKARMDWALQNNINRLTIGHRRSNEASKAAIRKHGFTYTHSESRSWTDGATDDMLYYELPIGLLNSNDTLTALLKQHNIPTWANLVEYVRGLPYGRNANRWDLSLVISEKKGSCSSKHALLKAVADLNKIKEVRLLLGIYKMNSGNTAGIGSTLLDNGIAYIPEAHCYLSINGKRYDHTSMNSDISKLEGDILEEIEITPEQVADFKPAYHRTFLSEWLKSACLKISFDKLWQIREQCIANLSQ